MCYTPLGYIIFSLKNLKFYEGWGTRTGYESRGPDNPKARYFDRFERSSNFLNNFSLLK